MSTSYATFERLKNKGLSAFRAGDDATARGYLIQAAECMVALAEKAPDATLRVEQEAYARELISLAHECDQPHRHRRSSRARAGESDEDEPSAADWIVRDRPEVGFDDIAGLDDVKEEIRLKMIYPLVHPELATKYGIRTGGGVLLYGPPGTGKTMLARAIAHEVEATCFVISAAQMLSKWVGEAEQNIRKLFEAARSEPAAVIFIDEIEALVPKRTSDSSAVMQRVVPQILQELQGFSDGAGGHLLFVGATNRPWMLDEAMMRPGRFDTRVYIPLPDGPARYRLLEMFLVEKRPVTDDLDLGELCDRLAGYSGADIKYVADQAAARPFMEAIGGAEPRAITMADVVSVLDAASPSVRPDDLARFDAFRETGQ